MRIKRLIVWAVIIAAIFGLHDNPPAKTQAEHINNVQTVATAKAEVPTAKPKQANEAKPKKQAPVKKKPAPVPQPKQEVARPTVKVSHPIGCEHYRHLVSQYNWNVEVALAVIQAESGCNPTALNNNPSTGDYSVGLFQINIYGANARTRPSEAQLKDPATNIAWAYKLYSGNGGSFIGQWGVCRYKVACY